MELPHTSEPPSLSALKEEAASKLTEAWTDSFKLHVRDNLTLLVGDGTPTRKPHKLLKLALKRSKITRIAQLLCNAGPFGGYFKRFPSAYCHRQGITIHCRWHNHPPWPVQTVAHILGGCEVLAETVCDSWPDDTPLPTHYTEWGQDRNLATLADWLDRTKPFFLMRAESHEAIAAVFARMVDEGLDTRDNHIDLEVLHTYALEELDPAAEAPLDWARQL
ncbi:hypothetical protein ACEPAG_6768 [Sanghuangporus baumii]